MPDMVPVATQVQPPDPGKGLSLLSGILGVRQQQQALQTGTYLQQTAQAGAIEAQQSAKELQAGSKLLADPVGNGLIDEEGNPTKNAYSIIKSVMPTTGDSRYQDLLKTAQGHVEFRNSVQNLSQNEQGYISSRLAGIAADPDAHISDVVGGINDLKSQFKGTAEEGSVNRLVDVVKGAIDDAGDKHGMDGVRQVVNGFSRGAVGNTGITGPGGVVTPSATTMQGPGGLQPIQTNPMAPGGIRPVGQPLAQGLSPTEQPAYRGKVASATNLATGGASIDTQRAGEVSATAQNAQGQITLTKQADQLVDMIHSGKVAQWVSDAAKSAGINDPAVAARFELRKVLGQLKDGATGHAGSDARLSTMLEQFPDETAPNEVVHARMDNMRGIYRLAQERKDNLNAYQKKHGDLGGFQQSDDMITSSRDPLTAELHSLPKGSPDRQAFLKRTFKTPDAAQQAILRERAAYHTVGAGNE